jgi:hypothetical protein
LAATQQQIIAWIRKQVQLSFLAPMLAFSTLMLVAAATAPLGLDLDKEKQGPPSWAIDVDCSFLARFDQSVARGQNRIWPCTRRNAVQRSCVEECGK